MADSQYDNGYCDQNGNFLGYNPYMMFIPDLIPARRDRSTGRVTFTGNPRTIPRGGALITESSGQPGRERILSDMVEDKGADTAPRGSIPGTKIMDDDTFSAELAKRVQSIPEPPEPKDTPPDGMPQESEELAKRIAARRSKYVKKEEPAAASGVGDGQPGDNQPGDDQPNAT